MKLFKFVTLGLFSFLGLLLGLVFLQDEEAPKYHNLERGKSQTALIFLHGLYGSTLERKDNGQKVFLTLAEGLWGKTPLALWDPKLEVTGAVELEVSGVMEQVSIVPRLYQVDAYGEALRFLFEQYGDKAQVIPFFYDWRDDNLKALRKLDGLIDQLKVEGVQKIILIGHSMGGMNVSYYLRYGAQDFENPQETWEGARKVHAAIVAGVPYGGATHVYRNVQVGASLALSEVPLGEESYATFWAAYQLMPLPEMGFVVNKNGEPLNEEAFDADTWNHKNFSFLKKDLAPEVRDYRLSYLKRALLRGHLFKRDLVKEGGTSVPVPMLVVKGDGQPTYTYAVWSEERLDQEGHWIFTDEKLQKSLPEGKLKTLFTPGDKTVPFAAQTTPKVYLGPNTHEYVTKTEHAAMFASEDVQKEVIAFLKDKF